MQKTRKPIIFILMLGAVVLSLGLLQQHPIQIEHQPSATRLNTLGAAQWPTWQKEVSHFDWLFLDEEIAYVLEGEVTITPGLGAANYGQPFTIKAGDLITFPAGIETHWHVTKPFLKRVTHNENKFYAFYQRVILKIRRTFN